MDKYTVTKWFVSQIVGIAGIVATLIGISFAAVTAILALVFQEGITMNTLIFGCSISNFNCIFIRFFGIAAGATVLILFALFIISIFIDLTRNATGSAYSGLLSWLVNPDERKLNVYPVGYRKGIYTLKFKHTEWRYLFKKTEALVTIPSMFKSTIIENLEWSKENTTKPITIKRFFQYELNFIRLDPVKDMFSVITNTDKKVSFGKGEYVFDIGCLVNIYGNFPVKNNIFVKSIPFKISKGIQYIKVNYDGGYKISFSVLRERPQEESMWYSKKLSLAQ